MGPLQDPAQNTSTRVPLHVQMKPPAPLGGLTGGRVGVGGSEPGAAVPDPALSPLPEIKPQTLNFNVLATDAFMGRQEMFLELSLDP